MKGAATMPRAWFALVAALAAICASAPGGEAATEYDASRCLKERPAIKELLCLADIAKRSGEPAVCMLSDHAGVRWQCVAILAEHEKDAGLCRTIPRTDQEHAALRDLCVSDVAEVRVAPALCTEVRAAGLRDSCYLKVVNAGADKALCARIEDPGLKSACTGEPVYVK